jgi:hypothetical protein
MKPRAIWTTVAIGTLALVPRLLDAQERTLVIPTVFDEGRFIVTPVSIDDETIRLIADTAGGTVMFQESADRLKLKPTTYAGDSKLRVQLPPLLRESWIPGSLEPGGALIVASKTKQRRMANLADRLDGMLGQSWFAGKVWVLDYPARKMTVYRQRVLQLPEHAVKMEMGFLRDENGIRQINFPRITVSIDGKPHDMLLETGATAFISREARQEIGDMRPGRRAASFIVQSVFDEWRKEHPGWLVVERACIETEGPMIEVPTVHIAGFDVGPVWFMVRPTANYHEFTSQWTDKRVDGSIGGNALRDLRVMLDYEKAKAWVEKPSG